MGEELNSLDLFGGFRIAWEAKLSIDTEFPGDSVWSAIDPGEEVGIGLQQLLKGFRSDSLIDWLR